MQRGFKIAFVYMVSIIGAGFVTGQEILRFFTSFGAMGIIGVVTSGVLFSLTGAFILERVRQRNLKSFGEYLKSIMPPILGVFYREIVSVFVLAAFYIMIAGMSDQYTTITGNSKLLAASIFSFLCLLLSLTGVKFVVNLSSYISPFMVFALVLTGSWLLIDKFLDVTAFSNVINLVPRLTNNWFYSSVIYVSYNTLLSAMLLCSMYPLLKNRRDSYIGGILGGIMLMAVALLINSVLNNYYLEIKYASFPLKDLVENKGSWLIGFIYELLVITVLFISAVTNAFCFMNRMEGKLGTRMRLILCFILSLIAIPAANQGFAGLIGLLYPFFGALGLVFLVYILVSGVKDFLSRA